jgi:hypothetical protein
MTVTAEFIEDAAKTLLEHGLECLREDGAARGMFHLFLRDGKQAIVPLDMNDPEEKDVAAYAIRRLARIGVLDAVMLLSEVWQAQTDEAGHKEMARRNMSVREAGDAGLFPVKEGLMVSAEMPGFAKRWLQFFRRGEKDEVIPEGEPQAQDWNGVGGRFMNFFEGEKVTQ